jgi:uncharacterized protein (TIGR01244 family)
MKTMKGMRAMKNSLGKPALFLMSFIFFMSFMLRLLSAQTQALQKETIDGVRNFTRVDDTVGCAGATEPKALAEIAKRGYKSVINLREQGEVGAAIEESRKAAEAAGLKFFHLPLVTSKPDPAIADSFIKVLADPANLPVYIHCASANRAAALLLAKRMLVDKWSEEKAVAEATAIGLTNLSLRQFALDYVKSKSKSF